MREKPKLQVTRNYDLFEMHELNRPLHDDPRLLASMQKTGFMPSSPIQCVRNGHGKLKVVRGHHRLTYAERLGLPVWFVVDDSKVDIFDLEGGRQAWTGSDFLRARAAGGNADCERLVDFQKKHGLTLAVAASLLGGQSAGSNNHLRMVKEGTFRVSSDLSHAYQVAALVDYCRASGVSFAGKAAFVSALSMCLRVPAFDQALFRHRVKLHGFVMRPRSTTHDYLKEIDALYNYGAKGNRLALEFEAKEIGRKRQQTFGGKAAIGQKLGAAARRARKARSPKTTSHTV